MRKAARQVAAEAVVQQVLSEELELEGAVRKAMRNVQTFPASEALKEALVNPTPDLQARIEKRVRKQRADAAEAVSKSIETGGAF